MKKYRIIAAIIVVVALFLSIYLIVPEHKQSLVIYSADAYVGEVNALISGFHNATGFAVDTSIGGGSFSARPENILIEWKPFRAHKINYLIDPITSICR